MAMMNRKMNKQQKYQQVQLLIRSRNGQEQLLRPLVPPSASAVLLLLDRCRQLLSLVRLRLRKEVAAAEPLQPVHFPSSPLNPLRLKTVYLRGCQGQQLPQPNQLSPPLQLHQHRQLYFAAM